MKNEQEKSTNNNRNYIIIIALVFCAFVYCTVRGCGGNDANIEQLHKSTDNTMAEIEGEHATAGRELDAAGGQLNSAGETAGRIDVLINRSQSAGTAITAGIADCKRIVGECEEIVADSQRICREIEAANSDRKGSGG